MSRRESLLLGGSLLASVLVLAALGCGGRERDGGTPEGGSEARGDVELHDVTLYFPGSAERLVAERRRVPAASDEELAAALIRELLAGPRRGELYAPLPEGVALAEVHIGRTGIAYVDLATPEGAPRPSLGSQQELLAAYSLVNSLCESIPELAGVALLWNGRQGATFAGNLDTRRPLRPNRSLLEAGGS